MYVKHSYMAGLHHYLIIQWDDEIDGWNIGIAALPSKKRARKFAGGIFDTKEEVAAVTNRNFNVHIGWFLRELKIAMNHLDRRYGSRDWYAIPVNHQRFRVYRYILRRTNWHPTVRYINGELLDVMVRYGKG